MNDLYNVTLNFGVVLTAAAALWVVYFTGAAGALLLCWIRRDDIDARKGLGEVFWFAALWFVYFGGWVLCRKSKSGSRPRGTMTAASPSKNAAIRSELLKQGYRIGGSATESKGQGDTSSSSNWTN